MKKSLILKLLFIVSPLLVLGQWNQIGSSLEGEFDGDSFGKDVALNDAGNVLIVGVYDNPNSTGNTLFPGMVQVFDWNGTDWIQRGNDIDGTASDRSGFKVAIDSIGNTIAITSIYGDNNLGYRPGLVRIYDWNGSSWIQRGNDIEGEGHPVILEVFGSGLSLSSDGNTVAIGGPGYMGLGVRNGYAKVFSWIGNQWTQVGNTIFGDEEFDRLGFSVSLNSAGDKLAAGALGTLGNGINEAGSIKVLEFNGTNWVQQGATIYGEFDGDEFGRSVSLNATGTTVAVGAPGDDFINSNVECMTYVYEWNGTDWTQKGNTLIGESNMNGFGFHVRLNNSGDILASSAPVFSGTGDVQIFQWINNAWSQVGNTLSGENIQDIFGDGMDLNGTGDRIAIGAYGHGDKGQAKVFEYQSDVGVNAINSSNSVQIFPNPTEGIIHVINLLPSSSVEILDALGKIVWSGLLTNNQDIDLSMLSPGIYHLKFQVGETSQVTRIIKQ